MTAIAPTLPLPTPAIRPGVVDNRATYVSFGLAYVIGHGASALSGGSDPILTLPSWLPLTLLMTGLLVGTVLATRAATRAQRGASAAEARSGQLLGMAWLVGFGGLFLVITGLSGALDAPELQAMLWPAGSGFVVGMMYLAEGAARRTVLHYLLGGWLTLVSASSLLLGTPGMFWVLAIAGGGAYAVGYVLERRRLAGLG